MEKLFSFDNFETKATIRGCP